jgi:hypothetical protein
MKYLGVLIAIILLCAVGPAKAAINTCDGHIDILNVVQISPTVLAVDVKLTTSGVDLNLVGALGVDVNVIIRHGNKLVYVGACFANFQGNNGEIVTVHIDVGSVSILADADVTIKLGNLHIDLDLGLNILLGQDCVCHLVDGVVHVVNSLIGSLLGTPNCIVSIINVQVLSGNKLQVSVQLQSNVLGGLSLDLKVALLNRLGITANVAVQHISFSGLRGQIVVCVLDVSGAVNLLLDPEVNIQLCVTNINVNLALTAIVDVQIAGLDNCLDRLLNVLGLPHLFLSSGSLDITAAVVVGNSLTIDVTLDTSVTLGSAVNVDLHVVVYSSVGSLLNQILPCTFVGTDGEVVQIIVDLTGLDLSAGVFVYLELVDLDVAANVNLHLCSGLLYSLLNSLISPCLSIGSCAL